MVKKRVGDLIEIEMGAGAYSYCHIAAASRTLFYRGVYQEPVPMTRVPSLPIAFKIIVDRHVEQSTKWRILKRGVMRSEVLTVDEMFIQDLISGALSIYHPDLPPPEHTRPATLAECTGLERVASWDWEHIRTRLIDDAAGRPNAYVDMLTIDVSRVPESQR